MKYEPAHAGPPIEVRPVGGHIASLDALRGVAAMVVAVGHTMGPCFELAEADQSVLVFKTFHDVAVKLGQHFINGQTAVIVFFVLSGFVISLSLDKTCYQFSASSFVNFLAKRMARLYPAHVIAMLLIIGCQLVLTFGNASSAPGLTGPKSFLDNGPLILANPYLPVANVLMVDWTLNPVTWSLYVELTAAIFLPFFWWVAKRNVWWVDLIVILTLRSVLYRQFYQPAFKHLLVFYLGCCVATLGARIARSMRWPKGYLLLGAYLGMAIPSALFPHRIPRVIFLEAISAFFFIAVLTFHPSQSAFDRFLNWKPVRWLGQVSYSFYLYHNLFLILSLRFVHLSSPYSEFWAREFLTFAIHLFLGTGLALCAAYLSYRYVESPGIRIARSILGGKQRRVAS